MDPYNFCTDVCRRADCNSFAVVFTGDLFGLVCRNGDS
jgi:hypothetical protein